MEKSAYTWSATSRPRAYALRNDRGVALIIVLLVTALLIALVFEFAYATRISLRAAVNYRDSQRAYYLARSGVNFVGMLLSDNRNKGNPEDNLEQLDWQVVPVVSGNDTELRVRWEDEGGKIDISSVNKGNPTYGYLKSLFENVNIAQEVADRIAEWGDQQHKFYLLTQLHQFMSDEDYMKVKNLLTVSPVPHIDINTAPSLVLQSIGVTESDVDKILESRKDEPYSKDKPINTGNAGGASVLGLATYSDIFKVYSYATVGGYTKQVVAVITRSNSGFTINYWREL